MIVTDKLAAIFHREDDALIIKTIEAYLAAKPGLTGFNPGSKEMLSHDIAVIAIEAESGAINKNILEAHKKFYDLHLTLKGSDTIAFKPVDDCTHVSKSYNDEADYLLYDEVPVNTVEVPLEISALSPTNLHIWLFTNQQVL